MGTQAPLARLQSAAIAATTLSYSLPALAQSEGTGRPLGIDDIRLPIVLATGFLLVRQVYCSWAEEQDNDDFFDGYQRNDNVIGYDWSPKRELVHDAHSKCGAMTCGKKSASPRELARTRLF